jgi:hypothetical protein
MEVLPAFDAPRTRTLIIVASDMSYAGLLFLWEENAMHCNVLTRFVTDESNRLYVITDICRSCYANAGGGESSTSYSGDKISLLL